MYTPEGMFAFLGSVIIILTTISAATLTVAIAQYVVWRRRNGKR